MDEIQSADDLHIKITKNDGEIVYEEDGCTMLGIMLNCRGEVARSFYGAHSPKILKHLDKNLKEYFKSLRKTLKQTDNPKEKIKVKKTAKKDGGENKEKAKLNN